MGEPHEALALLDGVPLKTAAMTLLIMGWEDLRTRPTGRPGRTPLDVLRCRGRGFEIAADPPARLAAFLDRLAGRRVRRRDIPVVLGRTATGVYGDLAAWVGRKPRSAPFPLRDELVSHFLRCKGRTNSRPLWRSNTSPRAAGRRTRKRPDRAPSSFVVEREGQAGTISPVSGSWGSVVAWFCSAPLARPRRLREDLSQ